MQVHYRDEEAIYIQAAPDRVTVIFSTVFREETDRVFGKVFLQVRLSLRALAFPLARHLTQCTGICRRSTTTADSERSAGALHQPRTAS